MLKYAEKRVVRAPLKARPQSDVDPKALRENIAERFSKSFEHLAK